MADAFFNEVTVAIGAEWINRSEETLCRYGENTMPGGDRRPLGVVYPGSTAEVQAIVKAANRHGVALYPVSTGNNIGLGSRSAVRAGQVVLDLGRRMNRILDIDETLAFAVVEPGVSYQAMYDELVRRGDKFMVDVTSGPPQGGMLGNALDKGAGYGPYFDHFGFSCGMEIVLGNGEMLRTGDGVLAGSELPNWHVSKYSFGPILDGLFTQSNFGIVTRMGIWLLPRPPAVRSFHFTYPDDDDLAEIVDICRALKLSNFVPTLLRVANDVYLCGSEHPSPEYSPGSRTPISDAARCAMREKDGLGAWTVSGAFYGPSSMALEPQIERVRAAFGKSGKATYIPHEEALGFHALQVAINACSGVPGVGELGLLKWRPGGGNLWFLPGTPMVGSIANECQHISRRIYAEHGMDYMIMNVCSARFARGLHVITFDRENPDENARANACYEALARAYAERGIFVGRAPLDYHALHMGQTMPAFRESCTAIKAALDPAGVIAPGRYGIG